MSLFDVFNRKKREQAQADQWTEDVFARLDEMMRDSPVDKAYAAIQRANTAKVAGDFNTAWACLQEAKELYMLHATACNYTAAQTLDLDSSLSRPLADILRLENNHYDALVHIIYWATCSERPSKTHQQQLSAYFKRCNFINTHTLDLDRCVEDSRADPDFVRIRDTVAAWRDAG